MKSSIFQNVGTDMMSNMLIASPPLLPVKVGAPARRARIRRDHSGSTVKPVQRPKMKTKTQQVSEIPPASLAGGGGVGLRSHSCTPRTVMNSKISMLIPARTMMDILIQNVVFAK